MWTLSPRATRLRRIANVPVLLLALVTVLALSACQIPDPFVASVHTSSSSVQWPTFTDPIYSFTISYPPGWKLIRGYDGSHITLGSENSSVVSPLVTTVPSSPADALAHATPTAADQAQNHMTVTRIQIAGVEALDIFAPYIPSSAQAPNSGRALAATRTIVLAFKNDAGSTNVYTFLAYLPTDKAGVMSAAVQADNQMVTAIVSTFQLPAKIDPVAA